MDEATRELARGIVDDAGEDVLKVLDYLAQNVALAGAIAFDLGEASLAEGMLSSAELILAVKEDIASRQF